MDEEKRIGVFICHCGTNIAGVIDVKELAEYAKTLPNVAHAEDYTYVCSTPGQTMIRDRIKEHNLNGTVVAACSPRLHEPTFRKATEEGGVNQFLFSMANIREQDTWVHMEEPEKALQKAKDAIRMEVARASKLEPLTPKTVPVEKAALVIGAGIAGIQASLELADAGIKTYLVEKEPSIGGNMSRLDKTFPTLDCSQCILTPKMVDVERNPNIELMTYSEVEDVSGYIGNFDVTIRQKSRYVYEDKCNGCGKCQEVCPVSRPNEFELGLQPRKAAYVPFPQAVPLKFTIDMDSCIKCDLCKGEEACGELEAIDFDKPDELTTVKVGTIIVATGFDMYDVERKEEWGYKVFDNVVTGIEMERLISASGPTGGNVVRPSDGQKPKSVGFVLCAGSRDQDEEDGAKPYCSRVCCMYSLKHAHQLIEKIPGCVPYLFYMDIRSFGKAYEEFYYRIQNEGGKFIRGRVARITEDPVTKNLTVTAEDTLLGTPLEMELDMVVLANAVVPAASTQKIKTLLTLSNSPDGFLLEAHPKLNPMSTTTDGVFLAGMCQGPRDIPDVVAHAAAAAAAASIPIHRGSVTLEPIYAIVDQEHCGGCATCIGVCPYGATELNEVDGKLVASVNEAKCKGCGTCGSACPSGAIKMQHFTNEQIMSEIEAFAQGW
ncbi:MAG: 4Fe-4S binding protein [Halobacteriota archaeon]